MENLRLKYGNIELPIIDGYTITKSSQDVVYSDLRCGWDESIENLPERYQEVQIVNVDNNIVKAYGYVDSYDFGQMRETDVERDISITLMSPMKLATLRTVIAKGVYKLTDLIQNYIMQPLILDGFEIARIDIADRQITVNFNIETVEFCMSNLSNKFNFWWFIDEHKRIYIIDTSVLMNSEPNFVYNDEANTIEGLQYIKPTTTSDEYANVINFKNVRTYQESVMYEDNNHEYVEYARFPLVDDIHVNLKKGDELTFNYPIDINPKNVMKAGHDSGYTRNYSSIEPPEYESQEEGIYTAFFMFIRSDNIDYDVQYYIKANSGTIDKSNYLSIDTQNKDTTFVFITDSFFSNLVTGIRYNGDETLTLIRRIESDSALVWNNNKFINDIEINNQKGKISESGIVETTIDLNNSWKTEKDLSDIAQKYFEKNSLNYADTIELLTDENLIKVGDVIYINKFGIDSKYIVTNITERNQNNDTDYVIKAQNSNNLDNFVDTFRIEPTQDDDSREYELFVTHYSKESVTNTVEVVV